MIQIDMNVLTEAEHKELLLWIDSKNKIIVDRLYNFSVSCGGLYQELESSGFLEDCPFPDFKKGWFYFDGLEWKAICVSLSYRSGYPYVVEGRLHSFPSESVIVTEGESRW